MHVLVVAWEPIPAPRVPAAPRVAAVARGLCAAGARVTVVADTTTTTTVAASPAAADVTLVTADEASPRVVADDVRTTLTSGGLALQATVGPAADVTSVHAVGVGGTYGAVAVAATLAVPLVATPLLLPRSVADRDDAWLHQVQWWLTTDADVVVAPSRGFADRLARRHALTRDEVVVAPLPRGARDPVDVDGLAAALGPVHRDAVRRPDRPTGPAPDIGTT